MIAFPLVAHAAPSGKTNTHGSFTYAVYGDAPYLVNPTDTSETDATPAFIDAVNADPDVSTVVTRTRARFQRFRRSRRRSRT